MVLASFGLTACQTLQNTGTKQTIGAGSGALIGGILGSKVGGGNGQLWATGAGVLVGALIGSEIGKSLDAADKSKMSNAVYQAHNAPVGEPISWNNPESGNSGQVVATKEGCCNNENDDGSTGDWIDESEAYCTGATNKENVRYFCQPP